MSPRRMGKAGLIQHAFHQIRHEYPDAACFYMDYLEHSGKECYIAIDEFQQITEYPEKGVEGLLRSYIQFLPHVHFNGHTWYMQYALNRLFEQKQPVLNEAVFEQCIADIARSEVDEY